jgi:CP family cyanate transporter-like MFS transporter
MSVRYSSGDIKRFALLWWGGANLRVTLLAVPPVIPLLHRDLALDQTAIGALSGLPIVLFAAAAVFGSLLIARIGARRAVIAGLLVIGISSALRGAGSSLAVLFATTFVMGAGIAMIQPAFPAIVRIWLPGAVGFATAVYANGLLVGEILSAALTIPLVLPLVGQSWQWSFVLWSVPAIATAVAILVLTRDDPADTGSRTERWWPEWSDPVLWRVGLVLGGASSMYFTTNAFIPDLLHDRGADDWIGSSLAALNIGQIPASILIAVYPSHILGRRAPVIATAALGAIGVGGLLFASGWWLVLWSGVIGFAAAFNLIWTLALPPLLVRPETVHRLSAGIFTIGYMCSFVTPILGGAAWDTTGVPATVMLPTVAAIGVMTISVLGLSLPARG